MRDPAPRWRQVAAHVLSQSDVGAGHWWLEIALPAGFPRPTPGQFIQLLLPSTSSAAFLPRPMSVADVGRRRGGWSMAFLYAAVGTGTRALASLGPEARLDVLGPLGRGFPLERPGTPVLVAGGRGVAPLLFAARVLAGQTRRCEFLFGARDARHLVGLAEVRRRIASIGGRLHVCTDDGSRGHAGNVVSLLDRLSPRLRRPFVVHACGPHGMLKSLAHWSLRKGTPAYVAMESMMACGTGVCRGCAMPRSAAGRDAHGLEGPSLYGNRDFAMCCTDGPVFGSGDLDWDRMP